MNLYFVSLDQLPLLPLVAIRLNKKKFIEIFFLSVGNNRVTVELLIWLLSAVRAIITEVYVWIIET